MTDDTHSESTFPPPGKPTCPHCESELQEVLFDGNRFHCWTETERGGKVQRRGKPCLTIAALRDERDRYKLALAQIVGFTAPDAPIYALAPGGHLTAIHNTASEALR